MNAIEKLRAAVTTGSVVAFGKGKDPVWFRVVDTHGGFGLEVKEDGTNYGSQLMHRCYVEQVKAA